MRKILSSIAAAMLLGAALTGCSNKSDDEAASGQSQTQSTTNTVDETNTQALADEPEGDPQVETVKITLTGESGGEWADTGSISIAGNLDGGTITIVDKDGTVLCSKSGSGYQFLNVDPLAQGEYQIEVEGVALEDLYISAQTFDDSVCSIQVNGEEKTTASGTDYVSCLWSTSQE